MPDTTARNWKHHGTITYGQSVYHVWIDVDQTGGGHHHYQVTNSRDIVPPLGCGAYTRVEGIMSRFTNAKLVLDAEAE